MEPSYYGKESASSLSMRRRNLMGARIAIRAATLFGATLIGFVQSLEFLLRLSKPLVGGPTARRIPARQSPLGKSNKWQATSTLLVVSPTIRMGWTLSSVHGRDTREIFSISTVSSAHNPAFLSTA